MRLSACGRESRETILAGWEAFARTCTPAGAAMATESEVERGRDFRVRLPRTNDDGSRT